MSFGVIKITNLDLSELHEQLRRSTGRGRTDGNRQRVDPVVSDLASTQPECADRIMISQPAQ